MGLTEHTSGTMKLRKIESVRLQDVTFDESMVCSKMVEAINPQVTLASGRVGFDTPKMKVVLLSLQSTHSDGVISSALLLGRLSTLGPPLL